MNIKHVGITILVIIVLVGGGFFLLQQFAADEPVGSVPDTAVPGPVTTNSANSILAEGQIVPVRYTAVSSATGGRVAEVLVEEGQVVQSGDALVRLEAAQMEIALAQAESGVAQAAANLDAAKAQLQAAHTGVDAAEIGVAAAEANLALLQAGPLPEEIAAAESEIAAATAAINQAAGNRAVAISGPSTSAVQAAQAAVAAAAEEAYVVREAHESLLHNEIYGDVEERARVASQLAQANLTAAQAALDELLAGPSSAEQQAAYGAVAVAIAQRDAAQAQLNLLLAGPKEEQITIAQIAVQQAELAVVQAEDTVLHTEAAVAQAEAALMQAEAVRDTAALTLNETIVFAPYAGVVTSLGAQIGDLIVPNVPILTVADVSEWRVETMDLTELDVVSVAVGSSVDIQIDAIPGQTLRGTVTDIAAASNLYQGDVTYCVTIRFDENQKLPLRWGMTTAVDIDISS
jgi:HlyD family secretion protein